MTDRDDYPRCRDCEHHGLGDPLGTGHPASKVWTCLNPDSGAFLSEYVSLDHYGCILHSDLETYD